MLISGLWARQPTRDDNEATLNSNYYHAFINRLFNISFLNFSAVLAVYKKYTRIVSFFYLLDGIQVRMNNGNRIKRSTSYEHDYP